MEVISSSGTFFIEIIIDNNIIELPFLNDNYDNSINSNDIIFAFGG